MKDVKDLPFSNCDEAVENGSWSISLQSLLLYFLFKDMNALGSLIAFASIPIQILLIQDRFMETA